jgi:hypothetical protein
LLKRLLVSELQAVLVCYRDLVKHDGWLDGRLGHVDVGVVFVHLSLVDPRLPIRLYACSLEKLVLLIVLCFLLLKEEALVQGAVIAFHVLLLHSADSRNFLLVILGERYRLKARWLRLVQITFALGEFSGKFGALWTLDVCRKLVGKGDACQLRWLRAELARYLILPSVFHSQWIPRCRSVVYNCRLRSIEEVFRKTSRICASR